MFFLEDYCQSRSADGKKDETSLRTWMGPVILMGISNTLMLIWLSSAGQPRYPRPTGCGWQKGRECEWMHFCLCTTQLRQCLESVPNEVNWLIYLLFQGLPGIDGKDGTPGIPGIKVRVASRDNDEKLQSQWKMTILSSCVLSICRAALARLGCLVLLVLREQRWVIF